MRLVALLFLLLPTLALAQEPKVVLTPETTAVSVGQRFRVRLHAEGPAGISWSFPTASGSEDVELSLLPQPPSAPPLPPGTIDYLAAVYTLDKPALPPLTVGWKLPGGRSGQVQTEAVPLQVTSLIAPDEKEPEIADVRPPVALGIGRPFWIALGVASVLVIALAIWLVRRLRRSAPVAAVVEEVAAHLEALRALEALSSSEVLRTSAWRAFYIALADVAKRYLERRLQAPVQEMTSREMLAFLEEHPLAAALALPLRDVTGAADAVKFARGASAHEEALRHLAAVRQAVTALEARLAPAPVAETR